jgi:1,4-dihydroxy-2-naphthoate octaprenyltransferase
MCFASGALEVILGRSIHTFPHTTYQWLLLLGLVIFTTIQAQDMGDQEGDSRRSRWTVPLVIGDVSARYTIAAFVVMWSYLCASFWKLHIDVLVVSTGLGLLVGGRFLFRRTAKEDNVSFRFYNLWVAFMFSLPLWKS